MSDDPARGRAGSGGRPDDRALPRRLASAAKAVVRRNMSRLAKVPEIVSRRVHRAYLITRKWSIEYGKEIRHRVIRAAKVSRKKLWLLKRWIKRRGRYLRRLMTLFGSGGLGRSRTLKRAEELAVVKLDEKPFEPSRLDLRREIRDLRNHLSRASRRDRPLVIGPWLTEIGFELLYWVPFAHWAKAYGEFRDRELWVVSRGGTATWYRHVSTNYIDVFDYFTPEQFRERNIRRQQEQGGIKHRGVSSFDEEILDRVGDRLGTSFDLLHPSWMYNLYQPFFQKAASFRLVEAFSFYSKILEAESAGNSPVSDLDEPYVAVKFYGNDALPMTPENRTLVARLLRELTRQGPVVWLDTGIRYDDHVEFAGIDRSRVHSIDDLVEPKNNLEVQTRIVHSASALYCTYGGFSYLAPLCDTRTVTLYSDRSGFRLEHLELARRVFARLDCPPFLALDVAELPSYLDMATLTRVPA